MCITLYYGRTTKIYGRIRLYTVVYGCIRLYTVVYGCIRSYTVEFDVKNGFSVVKKFGEIYGICQLAQKGKLSPDQAIQHILKIIEAMFKD